MGRPRVHVSSAARQRAYRERRALRNKAGVGRALWIISFPFEAGPAAPDLSAIRESPFVQTVREYR